LNTKKQKTIIASLREGLIEQSKLDITFEPGDEVIFSVKGPDVFLFGMSAPDVDSEDYSMNTEEEEAYIKELQKQGIVEKQGIVDHDHSKNEHEHDNKRKHEEEDVSGQEVDAEDGDQSEKIPKQSEKKTKKGRSE